MNFQSCEKSLTFEGIQLQLFVFGYLQLDIYVIYTSIDQ